MSQSGRCLTERNWKELSSFRSDFHSVNLDGNQFIRMAMLTRAYIEKWVDHCNNTQGIEKEWTIDSITIVMLCESVWCLWYPSDPMPLDWQHNIATWCNMRFVTSSCFVLFPVLFSFVTSCCRFLVQSRRDQTSSVCKGLGFWWLPRKLAQK